MVKGMTTRIKTRKAGLVCGKHEYLEGERRKANNGCVECLNEKSKARRAHRYHSDPSYRRRLNAANNARYSRNKEKYNATGRLTRNRIWAARKRLIKIQQQPSWVTWSEIDEYYKKAHAIGLTVDHRIPLKHKLVCGLHCPDNFQMLTYEQNRAKSNIFEVQ